MRSAWCIGIALAAAQYAACHAQSYPVRPVRLVVGFLAGGAVDVAARLLAPRLTDVLGQSLVIDNRPGAGGVIAAESVAKAAGDGYTLLMIAQPDVVQPALRKNLPYDIVKDFSPISLIAVGPYILCVHPVMPVATVKDLIALARARPGTLNYASAGIGSSAHLANELFNTMAQVKIVHVPFKGTPEGMTAIASGSVDMVLASVAAAQPLLAAGKVKGIGITSAKRFPLFPALPTISESGLPGFERSGWYGITAPVKTPRDIVDRLSADINKIVGTPEIKEIYVKQGLLATANSPDQFASFIRAEAVETGKLVKAAGFTSE
jgi:tripartite-type tricarboxylate transporter receptor subunit TctC